MRARILGIATEGSPVIIDCVGSGSIFEEEVADIRQRSGVAFVKCQGAAKRLQRFIAASERDQGDAALILPQCRRRRPLELRESLVRVARLQRRHAAAVRRVCSITPAAERPEQRTHAQPGNGRAKVEHHSD